MAPQIITLVLIFVNLLLMANFHGKEKEGKHNFWTSLAAQSITVLILYWGGYFDCFFKN
jgi:hypothetical protein